MKIIIYNLFFFFLMSSCLGSSPGTLGATADETLNCSEIDVSQALDNLIDSTEFTIPKADSNVINWWSENGYDFLNYRCLKIKNNYYMISIHSENTMESSIAIRSQYFKKNNEWKFAAEFNSVDEYNAEKAMEYLLENIPSVNN